MLKGDEGVQVIADLSQDSSTGLVTLPAQLSLQALQGQSIPGFTVGGEGGQQVLVVTDASQLEMLQVRTIPRQGCRFLSSASIQDFQSL